MNIGVGVPITGIELPDGSLGFIFVTDTKEKEAAHTMINHSAYSQAKLLDILKDYSSDNYRAYLYFIPSKNESMPYNVSFPLLSNDRELYFECSVSISFKKDTYIAYLNSISVLTVSDINNTL
jgi:hypothetical protein